MLLIAQAAQGQAAPAAKASTAPDKEVCRREAELGSRIANRVCRTQAEWEEIARQTQADLESSRNDRQIAPN
jgi:hypothetical protein